MFTYPLSYYDVAKQALLAGKHVYTEKMTTETVGQANELIELAKQKNLFIGGSMQLVRPIIDSGIFGTAVMAQAFLSRSYHQERYYIGDEKCFSFCRHGGIVFDMSSYYLTAVLIFLLGEIEKVDGFSKIHNPLRVHQNPKSTLFGIAMVVESYNNTTGSIKFKNGVLGTFTMTSESASASNRFVIHCTDGVIDLGDPNEYEASVKIYNKKGEESIIKTSFAYRDGNFCRIGLIDAAYAIKNGRKLRCNAKLNRHVLETALGICKSSESGET